MDSATADATCQKLVSILALAAGFEGITASALYTLTNAFENYTQQIYRIAHSFAELAGRTQPNVYDLQQAFTDMSLSAESLAEYAKKASQSSTPLLQGPLQETMAKPKKKKVKTTLLLDSDIEDNSDSDEEDNKDAAGNKITARTPVPDHLPPFPSKHSYRQTPVYVKRPTDPQKIRELNAEQSRLVESNLKRLMAAENKVAMAAHKDTLQQHQQEILPVALGSADLANAVVVKEEPGLSSSTVQVSASSTSMRRMSSVEASDRRAGLMKLEILPVVNYETAKRQQQLSASGRDRHEMKGGHMRGESGVNGSGSIGEGANSGGSGAGNSRAEWRTERRRLRKESLMEGMDTSHKRQRQETRMKLVSMETDS
ncbi:transcription initiation factor TFIID subunit 8 [Podila verticillata]|nr:transcription initiation factor TFIID subunit 8 [Podila verticillata]KAF9387782.1 transcription initiation factor TFIID subunit 8 [Podila verticillata]